MSMPNHFAFIQNGTTTLIHTPHIQISCDDQGRKELEAIFARAFNTWDEAGPDMKTFADLVIWGKPLQEYHRNENAPVPRMNIMSDVSDAVCNKVLDDFEKQMHIAAVSRGE